MDLKFTHKILETVESLARAQRRSCALVGGVLRDQLLGREPAHPNFDLAVDHGAMDLAQALAKQLKGTVVPLDEEAGSVRVVAGGVELDLNDYRAPTLQGDLALRDFTVNALAVPLAQWLSDPGRVDQWIDPLGGKKHLAEKRLVPCYPGTFRADPLRILRAGRFMAQLDFTVDGGTVPLMRSAVAQLGLVAGERIREELLLMMATDRAHPALVFLDRAEVLDVLLPELAQGRGVDQGDFHHLDVFGHQLEAVRQGDRILSDFAEFSEDLRESLTKYCAADVTDRHSRKALIKWAALLHDVGKPLMRQVHSEDEIWFIGHEHAGADLIPSLAERFRLSNREAALTTSLVRHHLRPGFLSREADLTRRAVYRFYKDLGDDGPACLIMWWCDRMATRGSQSQTQPEQIAAQRAFLEDMLRAYFFKAEEVIAPPKLIDGRQLMQALGLRPGPLVGRLVDAIEEAQAEGRIRSAEEALALARATLDDGSASDDKGTVE